MSLRWPEPGKIFQVHMNCPVVRYFRIINVHRSPYNLETNRNPRSRRSSWEKSTLIKEVWIYWVEEGWVTPVKLNWYPQSLVPLSDIPGPPVKSQA